MLRASLLHKAGALARHGCGYGSYVGFRITPLTVAQRFYATTPKHIRKRNKLEQDAQRIPAYAHSLVQLRSALEDNNLSNIAQAYHGVRTHISLGPQDVAQMAQTLHFSLRQLSLDVKQKRIPDYLSNFADLLVQDIRERRLPPSYSAHLHLLSFYKEAAQYDKGKTFWAWLVHQNDTYVNLALYGVAIELLAVQGSSAEDTELLYADALKRFPGTFNEYHLSHNAVVSDRSQHIRMSGISMTLLQGILTARLLRGDTPNAYLTLDTALRLHPTQVPSRCFALFIQERPVTEAYKVFLLACRSGTLLGQDALKTLLTKLRKAAASKPFEYAAVIRFMLTASYAYVASDGIVTSNHLNELVIAITSLLKVTSVAHMSLEERQQITANMKDLLEDLFAVWASRNSRPGIAAFNSIITNLAGMGKRLDVIQSCLADIERSGLKPNFVTRRSIVHAAGDIGDTELLQTAWTDLVALRIASGAALDLPDWQTLAKAAKKLHCIDYVRQQLANFQHVIPQGLASRIDGMLDSTDTSNIHQSDAAESAKKLLEVIYSLRLDTRHLASAISSDISRDFSVEPLPISLGDSNLYKNVPDDLLRALYNEMTTDPTSAASEAVEDPAPPVKTTTGFSFHELRFQNWKAINELLSEAEVHDSEYMAAVDAAIKNRSLPPKRDLGLTASQLSGDIVGLSGLGSLAAGALPLQDSSKTKTPEYEEIRQETFRLRGRMA